VVVLVNENSSMAEIAIDAKETSNDVLQTTLAIESSVRHVDGSVTTMPLSCTSEFIDNYPVPKPEVAEGFVGYAVDTNKNEYDITVIGYNYIPSSGDKFAGLGTITTNSNNNNLYVLKNGNFFTVRSDEISLYTGGSASLVSNIDLSSPLYVSSKIDIDDKEYIAFTTTIDKQISIFLYDSELNLVRTFDSSRTESNHYRYQASGGLFFIINYGSNTTMVSIYDFYTGKYLYTNIVGYTLMSATHAFADEDLVYILKANGYLEVRKKESFDLVSNSTRITTETIMTACYLGYKKLFIITTNSNGFVFDLVTKKSTSTRSYGSTANVFCTSDAFTATVFYNNKFYRVDEQHNIVYENTGFQGNFVGSYSFPYFYQRSASNYIYKFKDLSTQKLSAKAEKRG
jgi:hypothetical protein